MNVCTEFQADHLCGSNKMLYLSLQQTRHYRHTWVTVFTQIRDFHMMLCWIYTLTWWTQKDTKRKSKNIANFAGKLIAKGLETHEPSSLIQTSKLFSHWIFSPLLNQFYETKTKFQMNNIFFHTFCQNGILLMKHNWFR